MSISFTKKAAQAIRKLHSDNKDVYDKVIEALKSGKVVKVGRMYISDTCHTMKNKWIEIYYQKSKKITTVWSVGIVPVQNDKSDDEKDGILLLKPEDVLLESSGRKCKEKRS